jgi:hypothetical protein
MLDLRVLGDKEGELKTRKKHLNEGEFFEDSQKVQKPKKASEPESNPSFVFSDHIILRALQN